MKLLTQGEVKRMLNAASEEFDQTLKFDTFYAYYQDIPDDSTFGEEIVVAVILFMGGRGVLQKTVDELQRRYPQLAFRIYMDSEYVEVYDAEDFEPEKEML